jgi:L-serine dehydratase
MVPFTTGLEMESYGSEKRLINLADLALHYEAARGGIERDEVMQKTLYLVDVIENSIQKGLQGTLFKDRILGFQSGKYAARHQDSKMLDLGILDQIIPYVTALMENKSAMGVIVAAPTAGSCGGLPGTVMAVADTMNLGREVKARGLLAAGVIGALIATKSTFAAEVCGCQAECGVSSGMIAAAMVSMMGGDYKTSLAAASMALQNSFGMVCDPVANRVEVPCLGKNILAASNGVSCANLALAGFDHVIPFDEVVEAMDSVGRSLPHELRCTALGGLSITPTSKKIEKELQAATAPKNCTYIHCASK